MSFRSFDLSDYRLLFRKESELFLTDQNALPSLRYWRLDFRVRGVSGSNSYVSSPRSQLSEKRPHSTCSAEPHGRASTTCSHCCVEHLGGCCGARLSRCESIAPAFAPLPHPLRVARAAHAHTDICGHAIAILFGQFFPCTPLLCSRYGVCMHPLDVPPQNGRLHIREVVTRYCAHLCAYIQRIIIRVCAVSAAPARVGSVPATEGPFARARTSAVDATGRQSNRK